ncbi:hypothetical protein V8C86DRAFT_2801782 [Haematococcus lacustris]
MELQWLSWLQLLGRQSLALLSTVQAEQRPQRGRDRLADQLPRLRGHLGAFVPSEIKHLQRCSLQSSEEERRS